MDLCSHSLHKLKVTSCPIKYFLTIVELDKQSMKSILYKFPSLSIMNWIMLRLNKQKVLTMEKSRNLKFKLFISNWIYSFPIF